MFEQYKLNKNFNDMIGYAYEFGVDEVSGKFILQLYIVTKKNDQYGVVRYKKFTNGDDKSFADIIDRFCAKPLWYYVAKKEDNNLENIPNEVANKGKTLVKRIFRKK